MLDPMAIIQLFSVADLIALALFAGAWLAYAYAVERTAFGRTSLNARMNEVRAHWMRRMVRREMRMVDTQISASLQNGTAFFATTTLFAIGGALTVLRATDEFLTMMSALPLISVPTRAQWEMKTLGLIVILVYSFFKFAWSYRLFNYVAILIGATPPPEEAQSAEGEAHVVRTIRVFQSAGRHFNRGQRSFFFALGFLGWYVGPYVFMAATIAVVIVMWRRQFASDAWRAMHDYARS